MNTLIYMLLWSKLLTVEASLIETGYSAEHVSWLHCVYQRDDVLLCHVNNMYTNKAIMTCMRSQVERGNNSDYHLKTSWKPCTDSKSNEFKTRVKQREIQKGNREMTLLKQLKHLKDEIQVAKQKTRIKNPFDKWMNTKKTEAKSRKITLKVVTLLAASTRDRNMVYGHGSIIEEPDRLLSMKTGLGLSGRPVMHEHRIAGIKKRPRKDTRTAIRGLTTGPCPRANMYCIYMCIVATTYTGFKVIEERSVLQGDIKPKVTFIQMTKRMVVSVALNMDKVMYMLIHKSDGDTIKAYQMKESSDGDILFKETGSVKAPDGSLNIDVMKPNGEVFYRYGKRLLSQTKESFTTSSKARCSYPQVKFDDTKMFCTYKRKYVLVISKHFPFYFEKFVVA